MLVDSKGVTCEVLDLWDAGPGLRPWWVQVLSALVNARSCTVGYEFGPKGEIKLEDLKARIDVAMSAHPDLWYDEELAAGESDELVDEEIQLKQIRAKLMSARSVGALIKRLAEIKGED